MGTFDFMHGGEGGGLPQGRPPSLEAPPPPQIAGQLADAVAHGIKADATLRLGLGLPPPSWPGAGPLTCLGLVTLVHPIVGSETLLLARTGKLLSPPK